MSKLLKCLFKGHFNSSTPSAAAEAEGPPESVGTVLGAVAAGRTSARIAPTFRAFASKSVRESWSRSLTRGESLGCDAVGDQGISRWGSRIERVCYARATGADTPLVAIVSHTTN
jgi:hypothetical protein